MLTTFVRWRRPIASVALVPAILLTGNVDQVAAADEVDLRFKDDVASAAASSVDYLSPFPSPGQRGTARSERAAAPSVFHVLGRYCADLSTGNVDVECELVYANTCPDGSVYSKVYRYTVPDPTPRFTGVTRCVAAAEVPAGPIDSEDPVQVVLTASAFQELPIPPSRIVMDMNGFSLRNAHTNIYAKSATRNLSTVILGSKVRIRATPVEYRWTYGDGSSRRTAQPGAAAVGEQFVTETATSHQYTETGDYPVGLSTAYTGQYSVEGGPWLPVSGIAIVPSPSAEVSVWRTKKLLVDTNCGENPRGPACDSPFETAP